MTAADRIAEIRAREQAATSGPWGYPFPRKNRITTAAYIDVTEADWGGEGLREYSLGCTDDRNAWRAEDAEFIAHAREDVPHLLAALDAVLALCDEAAPRRMGDGYLSASVLAPEDVRAAITDALGGGA